MKQLAGKTALVTGAAQGIGEAIAVRMAEAGARVCFADLDGDKAEQAAKNAAKGLSLTYGADVTGMQADVSSSASVRSWIGAVMDMWGRIDILVNNAGIQLNRASVELTDDEWRKVMGVDMDGVFYCCREAGKVMLAQRSGSVVNISSIAERFGMPRRLPYSVAKAGVSALTRGLAAEWALMGVRVNAIAPGYVETELNRYAFAQGHINRDEIEAKIPLRQLAQPREIAEAALFLASDQASYVTGQVLYVDGGYSILK